MINIAIHKRGQEILSWSASYYDFKESLEYCVARVELDAYPSIEELDVNALAAQLYLDANGKLASDTLKIVDQVINPNYVEPPEVAPSEE